MRVLLIALLAGFTAFVHGHSTVDEAVRRCEEIAAAADTKERASRLKECLAAILPEPRRFPGGIETGMTREDILKSAWGKPLQVKRRETPSGILEEWLYDRGSLFFDGNGRLTSVR